MAPGKSGLHVRGEGERVIALEQARQGRLHIMGEMMKTISEPRAEYKEFVPRMVQLIVDGEFIGAIIGKGGETIQKIQRETGTTITITEQQIARSGPITGTAANRFTITCAPQ